MIPGSFLAKHIAIISLSTSLSFYQPSQAFYKLGPCTFRFGVLQPWVGDNAPLNRRPRSFRLCCTPTNSAELTDDHRGKRPHLFYTWHCIEEYIQPQLMPGGGLRGNCARQVRTVVPA